MVGSCTAARAGVCAALDVVVENLLHEAAVDRPPVDAVALAQAVGLEVRIDRSQRARGRLVRRCRAIICLRPEPRSERIQWAVAHEIGEHIMPVIADRLAVEAGRFDPQAREELANLFAGRLLVPAPWWEFDAPMANYDLCELKSLYATVSYEVLALRMLDLDPPSIVSVFDNGRLSRRECNHTMQFSALHPAERECQRCAHELGTSWACAAASINVQAWPIHEPGWKREILRTVVDADPFPDDITTNDAFE